MGTRLFRPGSRRWVWRGVSCGLMLVVLLVAERAASAQETAPAGIAPTTAASASAPATRAGVLEPGTLYGPLVLLPPILTIALAIWWRQVIPALAVGIVVAAYMLAWAAEAGQFGPVAIGGLRLAVEDFLIGAIANVEHVKIIVFTLFIGAMVGIIAANGGTAAIVNAVARWASSRRRGQLVTWLAGLLVFFDDYANAMIVGPSMRPVCDRLKISRAKLAYVVDSTAAPVSSIALISTWVGAELSYIQEGLDKLDVVPVFMQNMTAYRAFLGSIPYRFYAILALVMVVLVGLLDRDFGPMRKAERAASLADADPTASPAAQAPAKAGRAWYALVPVLVLVFLTLGLLFVTGWPAGGLATVAVEPDVPRWIGVTANILYKCDSYNSILYGALAALIVAAVISLASRSLTLARTVESANAGMSRMYTTLTVLVLAWALSTAMEALQLGPVVAALLQEHHFDPRWLPLLIFLAACLVSFATGTSWGTMGILCPAAVTISVGLVADMPAEQALTLFYASVGAVLAGAVFGDHCSPISDTTVLSSLASECSLESHVWTQMPYALTVALVSILCGDVLCRYCEQPWWVGLLAGTAALVLIVLVLGRRANSAVTPASR